MTVQTTSNKAEYVANGSIKAFDYNFRVDDSSHMKVYLDGVLQSSGYSVSGVGSDEGGTVTLNDAPSANVVVTLVRIVPLTQQTDYASYDAFPEETHEQALDKLTHIAQQLTERLSSTMQKPFGTDAWDAGNKRITNVANPESDKDAVNMSWAVTAIASAVASAVGGVSPKLTPLRETPVLVADVLPSGVIPLSVIEYVPGNDEIWVFANGSKLIKDSDYTENSATSIVLTADFISKVDPSLTLIEIISSQFVPNIFIKSSDVSYPGEYPNVKLALDALFANISSPADDAYASFADLLTADLNGKIVASTAGYYADNPGFGRSTYVATSITGLTPGDTDGGSYFVDISGRRWELSFGDRVYISQFGAKVANNTFDNRAAIQACLDFCTTSGANFVADPLEQTWDPSLNGGSGGYVDRYFGIGSFHPMFVDGYCLNINEPRNFFIFGNTSRVSSIRYYGTTPGKCVLKLGAIYGSDWGYVIDGLGISATANETDQESCVLDHAIYGRNNATLARCTIRNSTFAGGLLTAGELCGYMMDIQQTEFRYGHQGGLKFDGPDNLPTGSGPVTTSITLQNVWARFCGGTGIYFRNQTWYVNLVSCGVDGAGPSSATAINRPEWAYQFGNVRGLTINGCGCEEVDRVMRLVSCDSIVIDGIKGTGWGPTDGTVADYAIEITGNGTNVNISGWPKGTAVTTGTAPTKKFNYVLGLTKADGNMGSLLVQIMDNGINYLETFHVANSGTYTKPIVWPNDTADGAHRAQRKTGNVTWPVAGVSIAPTAGQYGQAGVVRKITAIGGESPFTTHNLLTHFGGNVATTITVRVIINSQAGTTGAVWEGVANVTIGSGKSIPYFTKVSGNSGATPTLAWSGDTLQYSVGVNFFDSIIEMNAYSETTTVSVRFDT